MDCSPYAIQPFVEFATPVFEAEVRQPIFDGNDLCSNISFPQCIRSVQTTCIFSKANISAKACVLIQIMRLDSQDQISEGLFRMEFGEPFFFLGTKAIGVVESVLSDFFGEGTFRCPIIVIQAIRNKRNASCKTVEIQIK